MIRYMVVLGCSVNLIRATLCPLSNRKTRRLAAKFHKKCLNRNGTRTGIRKPNGLRRWPKGSSRSGHYLRQLGRRLAAVDHLGGQVPAADERLGLVRDEQRGRRIEQDRVAFRAALLALND